MKDENQTPQPWIDPTLEARIVASVLGETSAFEAAEIERLVAAHPELALFKRRIEATHALVESAHRPENPKIQLSPERRRKLLETIGVPAVAPPKKIHALPAPTPWWSSPLLIRAAACLIMTGLAVALLSSITLYQSAPGIAGFSDGEAGFVQRDSVAISVPHSATEPAPMLADVPLTGRLFRPDAQPTPPSFASAPALSAPPTSAAGDDVRSRPNAASELDKPIMTTPGSIVTTSVVTSTQPSHFGEPISQNLAAAHETAPTSPTFRGQVNPASPSRIEYADAPPLQEARLALETLRNSDALEKTEMLLKESPASDEQRNLQKRALAQLASDAQWESPASMDLEQSAVQIDKTEQTIDSDTSHLFRGVPTVAAKDEVLRSEQNALHSLNAGRKSLGDRDDRRAGGNIGMAAPSSTTTASVSANSIDALLFGTPSDQVVPAPVSPAPMATSNAPSGAMHENVINQPIFSTRAGEEVVFDGFINYGSPINTVTVKSGARVTTYEVREFSPPTEYHPSQVEEAKKLLQEAEGFSETGRYDLATKRYEQALNLDRSNAEARRRLAEVQDAKTKYYDSASNATQSRALWQVDRSWERPVRRFQAGPTTIVGQQSTAPIVQKLNSIVIPRVDMQETSVAGALEFLRQRARDLDTSEQETSKKGVKLTLDLPADFKADSNKITLQLNNVSLMEALRYVTELSGLKYKINAEGIAVVPLAEVTQELVTKEYRVPAGYLSPGQDAKAFLEAQGVFFPAGATAIDMPGSGKLLVKNTHSALEIIDSFIPMPGTAWKPDASQAETPASQQPFSTFSLHVSDVSFQLAKDALARGSRAEPDRIRAEEFYNAFDYNDPAPGAGEEVACRIEQAAHPFLQQRNLVRIAVKVAAVGRAANQPLRLTVLLDTSGSMEREDRAASVRRALQSLVSLLGPSDRITLIGFARTPRLLAENVPGDQAEKLVEIAAHTPSQGGTNLEEALTLASELALKHRLDNAQNRIVLLTDGAANLGNANPERLATHIQKTRQQGISFDACGVGANGLNDEILEALTRKGDGRYYFLNKPEDAGEGFARRLAGAFRPAAENVKVQVVFNPARVGRYRLIGFEQHLLKQEDFRNDSVQAAELSAEEAGVALYQIEPLPEGNGELGEVFVRFRDPATGRTVERSWTMPYEERPPSFDRASPSLQLAGVSALLAEKLRGNEQIDLGTLAPVLNNLRAHYGEQPRVGELLQMFEHMRR